MGRARREAIGGQVTPVGALVRAGKNGMWSRGGRRGHGGPREELGVGANGTSRSSSSHLSSNISTCCCESLAGARGGSVEGRRR
jgi:hypothetical protein